MNIEIIRELLKSSFCNLMQFKVRPNALEVITGFSTINRKIISIFIVETKGKIVVTDFGWTSKNFYETPLSNPSEDIIEKITQSYLESYEIKITEDYAGNKYYYKSCQSLEEIPSNLFDLANFIVGVVNARCVQYKDNLDDKEKKSFRQQVNNFFTEKYANDVFFGQSLDDIKEVKFNAIVRKKSELFLFTYITGSNSQYFNNELRKAIVNFEISQKSTLSSSVKEKIAIINDNSEGYKPEKASNFWGLLNEKTTREPIKWSQRNNILEIIHNN